jgi:hypothetical protein
VCHSDHFSCKIVPRDCAVVDTGSPEGSVSATQVVWHALCLANVRMEQRIPEVKLTWLPHWGAYSVRLGGRIVGMVRCKIPHPFRLLVEFA